MFLKSFEGLYSNVSKLQMPSVLTTFGQLNYNKHK
jgi:hypothetical protein